MSEWHSVEFAQQGWQCPICRRVYSPTTPMCYYCGNGVPYTVSSTTVVDAVIDWLHHESVTNAEKPKEEAQETPQPHPCKECNKYGCDVHCPFYGK